MLEQEENTEGLSNPGIDAELNLDEQVSNLNLSNSAQEPYNSNEPFEGYIPFEQTSENAFVTQNLVTGDPYNTTKGPPTYQPLGDLNSLSDDDKRKRQTQYASSLKQVLSNDLYSYQDPNQWGGLYKYNSGMNSSNYWKRYHNLWGDGDHELDFHPLHDNEAAYNMATSWGERASYSLLGMAQLAIAGFASTYRSMGDLLEGKFWQPDYQVGRTFEEVNANYGDSSGGVGGFVNNLVMNFGYTLGIIGSVALDGGFHRLFKLGASGKYVPSIRSARTYNNIKKANNLEGAVDGANTTKKNLDYLSDMGNARKWYQGWDFRRLSESTVGRAANPFSNMTARRYAILDGADDLTGFAKTVENFGSFYRDLRNINLAVGESRLESALNRDKLFDDLYTEHYVRTGNAPSGKDLERIISTADAEGYETSMWNIALIYFTNKLAFDNILNPTRLNNVFGKKIRDIAKIGRGDFGSIGRVSMEAGKGAVFRERGFRTWLNGWKTDPIAKSVGGTIGYFKVNMLEGGQEVFQDVIADANYEHYKKLYYSDPARKGMIDKAMFGDGSTSLAYYGRALNKQYSAEGLERFGSGFFMGFLSGGLAKGLNAARTRSAKIFDPKGYQDYVEFETQVGERLADQINDLGVKEFWDTGYFNAGTQMGVSKITRNGDIKENNDAELEGMISQVIALKKNKILDSYIENFKTYQNLTDEEFLEANPTVPADEVGKYKSKIPVIAEKLQRISKRLDRISEKYRNPIDISDMESWMEGYDDAVFMYNAWEEATKQAAFFEENWEDVSKRMISIQNNHYNNRSLESLSKSDSDLILTIRDSRGMKAEIARLKDEIKSLTTQATPESKEAAKQRKKRLNALEQYYDNWKKFDEYFHRDRYKENAKRVLQSEKEEGEEVSDEEIDKLLNKQLGKKNVKTEGKLINKLKDSYKKLLVQLGTDTDFVFDDKASEGFRDVLDYYKLSDEKTQLATLINVVNDPQGFYKLYEKNTEWMKRLYNERGAYATEVVKRELNDIAGNGLLNVLAEDGIFMSAADFIAWKDHGIAPTEFYDEINQLVIPEDSPTFSKYMQKLYMYQAYTKVNDDLDQGSKYREYKAKKKAIEQRRLQQIEKEKEAFKTRNKVTVEEFEKENSKEVATDAELQEKFDKLTSLRKETLQYTDPLNFGNDIVSELGLEEIGVTWDEYISTIDQSDPKVQKLITKYGKQAELDKSISNIDKTSLQKDFGLYKYGALDIIDQTLEQIKIDMETEIVSEFDKTREGKVYTEAINKIDENYAKNLEELEESYSKEEKQKPVIEPSTKKEEPIDRQIDPDRTSVNFDSLDTELQETLTEQFELFASTLGRAADFKSTEPEDYYQLRNNWLKESSQRNTIAKYKAEKEANRPKTLEDVKAPELKSLQGTVPTQITLIDKLITSLNKDLQGEFITAEERNDKQFDLDALTEYRDLLLEFKRPESPTERNYELFKWGIKGRQEEIARDYGDSGETIGYSFVEGKSRKPVGKRVTQYAEELMNAEFKLDPFTYYGVSEKYKYKKGKTGPGPLLVMFDIHKNLKNTSDNEKIDSLIVDLERRVLTENRELNNPVKIDAIKAELQRDFTKDNFKNVVNRVAYSESAIAGDIVDTLFRTALEIDPATGTFKKLTKPDLMSDEAFDSLTEIIGNVQGWAVDNNFFFNVEPSVLFDKTAINGEGIAGAMDILAFNKETEEFHIIDIKTSKDFRNFPENKLYQYAAQQSIYRNLFHNMTGIMPTQLSLLPIQIGFAKNRTDGYIQSIEQAGKDLNASRIKELKAAKKEYTLDTAKHKARRAEIQKDINSAENSLAVDVSYIKAVEAGVPLVEPKDIPANLKSPVAEGKSFDPFLSEEFKEQVQSSEKQEQLQSIVEKIRKATTLEEVNFASVEAFGIVQLDPSIGPKVNEMLNNELDEKITALNNTIAPGTISVNEYFQSKDKNPIFEKGGNIAVVTRVYQTPTGINKVKIESIGPFKISDTMTIAEANKKFNKITKEEGDAQVTAEAKAAAKKSQEIQKEANAKTPVRKSTEGTGLSGLADKLKNYTQDNPKKNCD